jgi:hypothetical protein
VAAQRSALTETKEKMAKVYDQKLHTKLIGESQKLERALASLFDVGPKNPAAKHNKEKARQFSYDAFRKIWKTIPQDGGASKLSDKQMNNIYPEVCGALKMVNYLAAKDVRMPVPLLHAFLVAALKKLT